MVDAELILKHLITDELYFDRVFTVLQDDHFIGADLEIFKTINDLTKEYGKKPLPKEIGFKLNELPDNEFKTEVISKFKTMMTDKQNVSQEFLLKETTEFIKQSEYRQCILLGAKALQEGKDLGESYERLGKAMSFDMDTNIGLSEKDTQQRDEYRQLKQTGLSTGIDNIDEVLGGGFYPKTLNIICAVTHGGKSMFLSHFSAYSMLQGKNGLYLTLELPEHKIWDRIDANVLNINISDLKKYKVSDLYKKFQDKLGHLYVKEYGAGNLDVLKTKALYQKIQTQEGVKLDYICIDYLALMSSYSVKPSIGMYSYYKKIAEELHALSKELGIPIITAAQLNRSAYGNQSAGLESISDSLGIVQTADTVIILTRTKELDELNQAIMSFNKNRNTGNLSLKYVGIDFQKSLFFDTEQPDME